MIRTAALGFLLLLAGCSSASTSGATRPADVRSIILRPSDMPRHDLIVPKMDQYRAGKQITADDLPGGLTLKEMRADGITGLYVQALNSRTQPGMYGYPWQYLGFQTPSGAQRAYQQWLQALKRPFFLPAGSAHLTKACRYVQVAGSGPGVYGLLCRAGRFTIFGQFAGKGDLKAMMATIVHRTAA